MSRRPLVSLLIPVRNRPAMLRAALQSAIAQRYEPLEIVVCDNASTDDTAEVARELARSDERVQVYVNEHDVGGFNYPVTLRHSRGELVQFLNSDDVLDPACVERLASAMDRPETVMSFCRASFVDERGRPVDAPPKERLLGLESDAQLDGRDLGDRMLALNANIVGVPSQVMWRRSALGEASVMAIGARGWRVGDVAHWLALLARGDASYIHDELVTLRLHKGQDQARPRFRVEAAFDWLEMAEVAARHGFLRRPADQCAATTAALRQLAWRFDPALPEARDLLHGVRVAAERLRVHHGGPPSLRAVLGKTTTLFVERGDGSDSARLVRRWVSAYSSRTDVRLVIAAAPERLAAVRALLRPLREDPDAPASMANVEELPLTRAICLPGPVLLLEAGVTVDELKEAVPPRGRPECDEPWADPALAAMSDVERELRGRSGPPRWAA